MYLLLFATGLTEIEPYKNNISFQDVPRKCVHSSSDHKPAFFNFKLFISPHMFTVLMLVLISSKGGRGSYRFEWLTYNNFALWRVVVQLRLVGFVVYTSLSKSPFEVKSIDVGSNKRASYLMGPFCPTHMFRRYLPVYAPNIITSRRLPADAPSCLKYIRRSYQGFSN